MKKPIEDQATPPTPAEVPAEEAQGEQTPPAVELCHAHAIDYIPVDPNAVMDQITPTPVVTDASGDTSVARIAMLEAELADVRAERDQLSERITVLLAGGEEDLMPGVVLKAPIVKVRGLEGPSEDRRTFQKMDSNRFVQVEEINFRTAVGYDDNWKLNAEAALKRCLDNDFGPLDASGAPGFSNLPPFDPKNRVVVILAVLPPAGE